MRQKSSSHLGPDLREIYIEAHSPVSAHIASQTRMNGKAFSGIWVSSLTSNFVNGRADDGLFTADIQRSLVDSISKTTDLPVLVDIDGSDDHAELIVRLKDLKSSGVTGVVRSSSEVVEFADRYRDFNQTLPLICVPTTYCESTHDALFDSRFNIVIYANQLMRSSYKAMERTAEWILQKGSTVTVEPDF